MKQKTKTTEEIKQVGVLKRSTKLTNFSYTDEEKKSENKLLKPGMKEGHHY